MAMKADALSESGLYLACVRLVTLLEGRVHSATGSSAIQYACGVATQLGAATLAREGIDVRSLATSPITSAYGGCVGAEFSSVGPVISGKPPSSVLKALIDGGKIGEFATMRLLRLCANLGCSLYETMGVNLGLHKLKPIDFALAAQCDTDEEHRAFRVVEELGNHVTIIHLLGAARKPGRTSIASLLLILTEVTQCVAALDRERAKHQSPMSELAQLPTSLEPSVQELAYRIGACVLSAKATLSDPAGLGQVPLMGVVPWSRSSKTNVFERHSSASSTLLNEMIEPAALERLPKGAYDPSKTRDHLMGLGLATCMESTIRRTVAVQPSQPANPQALVDNLGGCMLVLAKCIGHGSLTTGSPPMLSLAVTLRKLLTAMAGADYARMNLPGWSSLYKAAGCSNPRCLNAAGDSEASLPAKKCGACKMRYCSRECQVAAYKVHKHVCGGKAAKWIEKASG
ncbi:hypothetical protein FOA52_015371 [Chlamydomonas sp. UWO 241]|nr:hypothetical protein FOA52_015371 [Chlamydomonas sp. UWO 241]